MSKHKPPKKKKVVVTTQKSTETSKKKVSPTVSSRAKTTAASSAGEELVIGKQTYMWMGIGAVLILLGMFLMVGGAMPSPDVWDPNLIYGFRRTVLAPIVIIAGFVVEIYAIFKK